MSKVISFSISDRYLDKLRGLYPDLTDNLAAKQFLTDRLDDSLDGVLDDKLKSLIETSLDGLLDERLDDAVGKFLSQVTERMARLEERLDDSLDDGLDDMEQLLKLQREASIASPFPNQENVETNSTDEPVEGADTVETANEPVSTVETVTDAIETVTDSKPWYTIDELLDCHYPGWPETKEGLRKKALRENWPKRTQRGSKGQPYEYQVVLPE